MGRECGERMWGEKSGTGCHFRSNEGNVEPNIVKNSWNMSVILVKTPSNGEYRVEIVHL